MTNVATFPRQNERVVPEVGVDLGKPWTATRASHILELPPAPMWIWDNRIMRGQVTILGGEAKVGKSLLMQQLLSSCAVGLPCLGRHTERCRAFGYFCEDTDDWLRTRQFAIKDDLGVEMSDFEDNLHWYSPAATDDCVLAEFEYGNINMTAAWKRLWREIDALEAELVVIDTAATVFAGNEMNRRQVTQFMRRLQQKAIGGKDEPSRAIVLAAHPPTGNTSKGYAGSGAWLASARAGLSLERPPEYDPMTDTPSCARVLRGIGANYSGGRASAKLRFDLDRRVFVADEPADPMPARTITPVSCEVLDNDLDGIVRLARGNGGLIYADVMHPLSAPNRYRRIFDKRKSSNDLYAAQNRLLLSGRWVRVRVGGKCFLRPAKDGKKYEGEQPWTI